MEEMIKREVLTLYPGQHVPTVQTILTKRVSLVTVYIKIMGGDNMYNLLYENIVWNTLKLTLYISDQINRELVRPTDCHCIGVHLDIHTNIDRANRLVVLLHVMPSDWVRLLKTFI